MFTNATRREYRERARRIRELADEATTPQLKEKLLQLADEYERMATNVEDDGEPR